MKINIITESPCDVFMRQFDRGRYGDRFEFFENSDADIEWDCVVVYEGLKNAREIRCRKGGLLFFSGEPSDSRFYGRAFLNQFDTVCATHKYIRHRHFINSQIALNWHYGFSHKNQSFSCGYDELAAMDIPQKTRNISVVTSSLCMMPGHLKRLNFIDMLKRRYGDKIDFFGRGIKFIDDKAEAINPYLFHICLENTAEKNYWSEKLADPILGYAVPIYFGDKSIFDYFPPESMYYIDINKPHAALETIDKILADPQKAYNAKIEGLKRARRKLIDEYNFFPTLIKIISAERLGGVAETELRPNGAFAGSKIGFAKLRLYRLLFKCYKKCNEKIKHNCSGI